MLACAHFGLPRYRATLCHQVWHRVLLAVAETEAIVIPTGFGDAFADTTWMVGRIGKGLRLTLHCRRPDGSCCKIESGSGQEYEFLIRPECATRVECTAFVRSRNVPKSEIVGCEGGKKSLSLSTGNCEWLIHRESA